MAATLMPVGRHAEAIRWVTRAPSDCTADPAPTARFTPIAGGSSTALVRACPAGTAVDRSPRPVAAGVGSAWCPLLDSARYAPMRHAPRAVRMSDREAPAGH